MKKIIRPLATGALGAFLVVGATSLPAQQHAFGAAGSEALMEASDGTIWHASNGRIRTCQMNYSFRYAPECGPWKD